MVALSKFKIDATVGQLPSYDYHVSPTTLSVVVADRLRQQRDLPGVIITNQSEPLGMISRRKFTEQMALPDRANLFRQSPIQNLLNFLRMPPLIMANDWPIIEAVPVMLNRPEDFVYEPVIVLAEDETWRLVDCHTVLMAHAQILTQIKQAFEQEKQANEKSAILLKNEQEKVISYEKKLAVYTNHTKKTAVVEGSPLTPTNKNNRFLFRQAQTLVNQHQKLLKLATLIDQEFTKNFLAISTNASTINANANEVTGTSQLFEIELDAIDRNSALILKIIQQVRHLTMQVSILVSHLVDPDHNQGQIHGEISRELNRLEQQSSDLSSQMNKIVSSMKNRVSKIMSLAHDNIQITQATMQKISRSQLVLDELKESLEQSNSNDFLVISESLDTFNK